MSADTVLSTSGIGIRRIPARGFEKNKGCKISTINACYGFAVYAGGSARGAQNNCVTASRLAHHAESVSPVDMKYNHSPCSPNVNPPFQM
jgi:hypothetical protein